MELTPREKDKLMLYTAGLVAERRLARGLQLNYPEAVALISLEILEAPGILIFRVARRSRRRPPGGRLDVLLGREPAAAAAARWRDRRRWRRNRTPSRGNPREILREPYGNPTEGVLRES